MLGTMNWSKSMAEEVPDPSEELTTDILLNGHIVKLIYKYSYLYLYLVLLSVLARDVSFCSGRQLIQRLVKSLTYTSDCCECSALGRISL